MKKVLAVLLTLNAAMLAGLLWKDSVVEAYKSGDKKFALQAFQNGNVFGNGDVNGDGTINIADPVYLLNWLFRGSGKPPVQISSPLPATGQTKCYDETAELPVCPDNHLPLGGQDGFYKAGCPTQGRFTDNLDGTVTDTCTGLMWAKRMAKPSVGYTPTTDDRLPWKTALKFCEDLGDFPGVDREFDGAGHDDWRLPNVRELQSIIDFERVLPASDPLKRNKPAVNAAFDIPDLQAIQPDLPLGEFWTSTTCSFDHSEAWVVGLSYGDVLWQYYSVNTFSGFGTEKTVAFWVLPVRTIQPGE